MRSANVEQDVTLLPITDIEEKDIETLASAGLWREARHGEKAEPIRVFQVKEEKENLPPKNQRRRTIQWPKHANNRIYASDWSSQIDLKTTQQQTTDAVLQCGATFDSIASFFQLRTGVNFGFRTRSGKAYVTDLLLMGHVLSAELMDMVHKVVAGVSGYAALPLPESTSTTTHIDNVRYAGTYEEVAKAITYFAERAREVSLKLNPYETTPTHQYKYCGVNYDHTTQTVTVAPKTMKKLANCTPSRTNTAGYYEYLFSLLFFASQILRAPAHRWWHAIAAYRKLCNRLQAGAISVTTAVSLSAKATDELVQFYEFCLRNAPTKVPTQASHTITLYTDASRKGWGGVLVHQGEILSTGGAWEATVPAREASTAYLEALATSRAVNAFAHRLVDKDVLIMIDSKAAIGAINRKRSNAQDLNQAVAEVFKHFGSARPRSISTTYVRSEDNLADGPSRNAPVSARGLAMGKVCVSSRVFSIV